MIAITAACLLGANRLEASFERALGCGREFTPITRRAAIDIPTYEVDNMAMTRSVPLFALAELQQVNQEPYHRCGDERIDSDIVGVRSSFVLVLAPESDKCKVMTALEKDLQASGWSVHPRPPAAIDGAGYVPAMRADRDHERLDFSFDGSGRHLSVVADHDAPGKAPFSQSNVDGGSTFDCEFAS